MRDALLVAGICALLVLVECAARGVTRYVDRLQHPPALVRAIPRPY